MKKIINLLSTVIILVCIVSCGNRKSTGNQGKVPEKLVLTTEGVQILYFHGDRRCTACLGIESVAANVFKDRYQQNPAVQYANINIDLEENSDLAKKFKATGSTLIINVNGKPNDITFEAFKLIGSEPDSLRNLMVDIVEKGLKK
jgi:hypothetical protein